MKPEYFIALLVAAIEAHYPFQITPNPPPGYLPIAWTPVTVGEDGNPFTPSSYDLYYEGQGNVTVIAGLSTVSYTLEGLTPGASYSWWVVEKDGAGVTHAVTPLIAAVSP